MTDTEKLSKIITDKINNLSEQLRIQWNNPLDTKTRYFVIDDLLPEAIASDIFNTFPKNEDIWFQRHSFREKKKTFAKLEKIDPLIAHITDAFHKSNVLDSVMNVTKIDQLEADPELYAGGISMMGKDDFLNPHIDNSHDTDRKRYRRLNLLFYITPDWKNENGGNLELWDDRVTEPKTITSKFNRLVVMETNKNSWHSVSKVVVNKNRCCVSNYYFSSASPEHKDYYHITAFLGRPNEKFKRAYGRVDNLLRQFIAANFKISRGKKQARHQ